MADDIGFAKSTVWAYERGKKQISVSHLARLAASCAYFDRPFPGDALRMRDLYEVVNAQPSCEVLVDDRPLPYARELWLPLVWFLIR